jgi:16S rRNA pseudouridine516 synthase
MQRLDKILSEAGVASRKELKTILRAGRVQVNGQVVRDGAEKFDPETAEIQLDGTPVGTARRIVLLLHKPAGYVTSTDDPRDATVMELLPPEYQGRGLFPVGRLDKQTEGLLLLTNDGALGHRLTSPKHGVEKTYYARHEGTASAEDVAAFAAGLTLRDGTVCRPAVLEPIGAGESRITVTEGKYHQVRRMMASRGMTVTYLRREKEGSLTLDGVALGAVRELSEDEIERLGENAENSKTAL